MSNRNFNYTGLNGDLNANRRTYKQEKKAYSNDQVITSEKDFEDANTLLDKVLMNVSLLTSLTQETTANVNTEHPVADVAYNREIFNRNLTRFDTIATTLLNEVKKLSPISNNLNASQIQELATQEDTLNSIIADSSIEYGLLNITYNEGGREQEKYSRQVERNTTKIIEIMNIIENIVNTYSPIAISQNPQSINGGYMLRPYISNRKFI
jgi:hypothetical protein